MKVHICKCPECTEFFIDEDVRRRAEYAFETLRAEDKLPKLMCQGTITGDILIRRESVSWLPGEYKIFKKTNDRTMLRREEL